ncbi:Z1 domain-containing protein [[Mycoplasma] testudinis]|uniref:Z1 domain-containing protein n=1 Tax=[Mycoplasma] testudinis TaxID=33924 RepID=UPI0004811242|nr:Z1 domain-containing protein [[Mycoplasma] testudinis]
MDISQAIKTAIAQFGASNHEEHFINYCKQSGMDDIAIKKIMTKANDVITTLGNKPNGLKGLLVGKVQSGKTSTFSACISRAFSMGYDMAIVLSGRDNVLNKQTFDRLKATFTKDDFSTGINVYQVKEVIASQDNKTLVDELNKAVINKHKTIFVSLKNQQIEKLMELLCIPLFKNVKFLVVDDEGDLASFNTAENKSSESATYRMLNEMLKKIDKNFSFLSVTATPQAHILLAQSDYIKPDYIFTIEPGEAYMGLNDFFGRDYLNYIIRVSNEEKQAIENEREQTPESFKIAILYYLVAAGIFHLENKKIQKTAMLVHTAKEILRHNMIADKINSYKKTLERFLKIPDSGEGQRLINQIKKIYEQYRTQIPWHDRFIDLLICHLNFTSINVVNSEIDDPLYKDTPNNIVVGSAMIERGVTFNNLLTTYITNRAEDAIAIDTALQRGRWFGYRRKYEHLMRIFMLDHLLTNFKDQILDHDNYLWNVLIDAETKHLPFNQIEKKLLISSDDLIATHKVKQARINFERYLTNSNLNRSPAQRKYCDYVFQKIVEDPQTADFQVGDGNTFRMLKHVDIKKVKEIFGLPDYAEFLADAVGVSEMNWDIFVNEVLLQFESKITIAIMDNNLAISKIRKRMIHEDGSVELFQPKNVTGNKYVGDKDWHKVPEFEDSLIFQIHNIYLETTHRLQKFIAIVLPRKIQTSFVSTKEPKKVLPTKQTEFSNEINQTKQQRSVDLQTEETTDLCEQTDVKNEN